jgi:hypothetical protein
MAPMAALTAKIMSATSDSENVEERSLVSKPDLALSNLRICNPKQAQCLKGLVFELPNTVIGE